MEDHYGGSQEPVTVGEHTVRPSHSWKVIMPDGSEHSYSWQNDAEDIAKRHPGAVTEPILAWFAGREIGAWVGICYLEGNVDPYGDGTAAIWCPTKPNAKLYDR